MYVFAGFMVGMIVGLTGVGGGALMTPLLILLFGVAPVSAVGTDLWFAAITKIVAGGVHHQKNLIDWEILKRLWLGSLPASALMIYLMHSKLVSIDAKFLSQWVAYLVILTAIGILFQSRLKNIGKHFRISNELAFKAWQPILTILAGAILGVLVTLTSIGAGALGVVLLTYLYPLRLTPARLVATDIVHAIPLAMFAGFGHLIVGHVDFELLAVLLLGSIPGVYIGARASSVLSAKWIRIFLAVVLIAVGTKLLIGLSK